MCNMQSSWPGGFAQRSDLIDFFVWCLILYIWKSGCFFKEDVCLHSSYTKEAMKMSS